MKRGEKLVTMTDLDARLKILSDRVNSILAGVAYDLTNGNFKNFMICSGVASVTPGADTTVTFPVEYAVTPRIIPGVESTDQDATARFHTPTTSGFKLRVINHTSGSAVNVHWIAFGKRI